MMSGHETLTSDEVLADIEQAYGQPASGCSSRDLKGWRGARSELNAKVMIVDDDSLTIEMVQEFLKEDGFTNLVGADDAVAAFDLIRKEQPDVLLLDVHMPRCSGLEILEAVREDRLLTRTPVVMLTAATDRHVRMQALQRGATEFLNKPVHTEELLVRLRNILVVKAHEDRLRNYERQRRLVAERELQAAERIQTQLFPKKPPIVAGLDVAGAAYSAGTGCGDYFDFLTLADGTAALVVGDVSGHGMPSALRMMETRAYLRSLAKHHTNVGRVLTELNQFMLREAAYGGDGTEQFVTLFLAAIDPSHRHLVYASAGHAGYVLSEGTTRKLGSTGLPLGIAEIPVEVSEPVPLQQGDVVVVTTDGVEEAMAPSGEQFGPSRMLGSIRNRRSDSAQEMIERLYATVREFSGGAAQRDDITAVIAKIDEAGQ